MMFSRGGWRFPLTRQKKPYSVSSPKTRRTNAPPGHRHAARQLLGSVYRRVVTHGRSDPFRDDVGGLASLRPSQTAGGPPPCTAREEQGPPRDMAADEPDPSRSRSCTIFHAPRWTSRVSKYPGCAASAHAKAAVASPSLPSRIAVMPRL